MACGRKWQIIIFEPKADVDAVAREEAEGVGHGGGAVRNFSIDGADNPHNGVASGEGEPAGARRALALRSVHPSSTSSKESSTRSRTEQNTIGGRGERTVGTDARPSVVDHMEAT